MVDSETLAWLQNSDRQGITQKAKDESGNYTDEYYYLLKDGSTVSLGVGREGFLRGRNIEKDDKAGVSLTEDSDSFSEAYSWANRTEEQKISELADLKYLAQNTGVSVDKLNSEYKALGLDHTDPYAFTEADKLLKANGYTPGDSKNFYGSNSGPVDVGAQVLYERWQKAPTEEELADLGMENSTVVNNTAAAQAYLSEELAKSGGESKTSASFSTIKGGSNIDTYRQEQDDTILNTYNILKQNNNPVAEQYAKIHGLDIGKEDNVATGYTSVTPSEKQLDMLEWNLEKTGVDTTGYTVDQPTACITGSNVTTGGKITGGDIPSSDTYSGPSFTSTPTIGVVTPTYGEGLTGTSEATIPTYEDGLKKQATQFQDRATCQATFYQPQTQQEKKDAGSTPAFENKLYRNRFGMSMYIQHINGVPSQPIPPGYFEVKQFTTQGQNQGGMIQGFMGGGVISPINDDGKNKFRIFYPNGTYSSTFYSTEAQAQAKIDADNAAAGNSAEGNSAEGNSAEGNSAEGNSAEGNSAAGNSAAGNSAAGNSAEGNSAAGNSNASLPDATVNQDFISGQQTVTEEELAQQQRNLAAQAYVAPGGAVAAAPTSYIDPNAYGSVVESTAGQAQATAPMVESDQVAQISAATQADTPEKIGAAQVTPNAAFSDVQNATTEMTAAQSTGPTKTIEAAQQTGTSLSGLTSATADSINVSGAPTRTMQEGEKIAAGNQGLSSVDQSKVDEAFGTGEVQAASMQTELAGLMQQFEGGETPAWAAGSMRAATQMLAARGLGASSMAGQAVIQAAMEAALPIAQIDTANKQQVALLKAEQRAKFMQMDFDQDFQAKVMNAAKVSDIANMNFTAEQQIALENSRAANTMQLQNLSNSQALVMAEAAALSQMDTQNLNNRQQANVQNAQNFLQIDMANLGNSQQTALFKQQSLINSLLTDQAAANAALQFNASSENQTNQFFANLSSSIGQFNAAQMNAMKQFNAGEVNSLLEFNASIQNQRELFNAQNYLVVAQANAQWRQNIATLNTAAANESNMDYAKTVNALTMSSLDQIWQRERDLMDYSFTGSENQADRALSLLLGDMELESVRAQINAQEDSALGALLTKIFFKI